VGSRPSTWTYLLGGFTFHNLMHVFAPIGQVQAMEENGE
jgi:hypothetical protein